MERPDAELEEEDTIPQLAPSKTPSELQRIQQIKESLKQPRKQNKNQSLFDFSCPNQRAKKRKMELFRDLDESPSEDEEEDEETHGHHRNLSQDSDEEPVYIGADIRPSSRTQARSHSFQHSPTAIHQRINTPKKHVQLSARSMHQLHSLNREHQILKRRQQELTSQEIIISDSDEELSVSSEESLEEEFDEPVDAKDNSLSLSEFSEDDDDDGDGDDESFRIILASKSIRHPVNVFKSMKIDTVISAFEQEHQCEVKRVSFDGEVCQRELTFGDIEDLESDDQLDLII